MAQKDTARPGPAQAGPQTAQPAGQGQAPAADAAPAAAQSPAGQPGPSAAAAQDPAAGPAQPARGRLTIFFGYAPGVGKTRAMLLAARRQAAAGTDTVVGALGGRIRPEDAALAAGFARLAGRTGPGEFDLQAALARKPALLVLDELAHTNAPGCANRHRYQDVQALLAAGISVYTTLNAGALESLSEMAASCGHPAAALVPDAVFDTADAVDLVDLEPAALPDRPDAADQRQLAALRALALRRAADRLERGRLPLSEARPTGGEHILVCLSDEAGNARAIRTAARLAAAFHGAFTALYVEMPTARLGPEAQARLQANRQLAETLGARLSTLYGDDPADQIAEYARLSGVTKIVLGRGVYPRLSRRALADRLAVLLPDTELYGIPDRRPPRRLLPALTLERPAFSLWDCVVTFGILALCTGIAALFAATESLIASAVPVYILGVLVISIYTTGFVYSLFASAMSVLIFNFLFVDPFLSLRSDPSYVVTIAVMFLVALVGGSLTSQIKTQAQHSAREAHRTEVLLETSQKLQQAEGEDAILAVTAAQLYKLLGRPVLLYPAAETGQPGTPVACPPDTDLASCTGPAWQAAAARALAESRQAETVIAGAPLGTRCFCAAARGARQARAAAAVPLAPGQRLEAFEKSLALGVLDECGLALEKQALTRAKQKSEETARQEALRANLLRAISHDLRTPLTSISGNAGILMENDRVLDEAKRRALYAAIYDDALWLVSLVENLLSITRIENGTMRLSMQPELLDEVFGEALGHLDRNAVHHHIETRLADDLLMANMDARLIVQVIINLVNNAIKYTPAGSHILLSARRAGGKVLVQVTDDGPGVSDEAKPRLFDMFYTTGNATGDSRRGLGLGLALCRSIITAHGGTITVSDAPPHGACFSFTLTPSEVTHHE